LNVGYYIQQMYGMKVDMSGKDRENDVVVRGALLWWRLILQGGLRSGGELCLQAR
jgi:hypothetical protein